jgi:hypothetical protein
MPSVLASTAREEARQALQWLSQAVYDADKEGTCRFKDKMAVNGPNLLAAAWIHALGPSSWDLTGHQYSFVPSSSEANATNLERLEIQQEEGSVLGITDVAVDSTRRVDMFIDTILVSACLAHEKADNDENAQARSMRSLPSRLFRLLLRIYLSTAMVIKQDNTTAHATNIGETYRFITILLLPLLCEKCAPEVLLFGDTNDNAVDLLSLVKLVLTSAARRLEKDFEGAIPSVATRSDAEDSSDDNETVQYLEHLARSPYREDGSSLDVTPLLLLVATKNDDSEQDETLLSVVSIILSLLIAVLELGSKLRSTLEEEMLKSFLPILQVLAEFAIVTSSSTTFQESKAGLADMASYAMALIASRQAPKEKESSTDKEIPLSVMDKLRKMIRQSEEDLESTQPPIRARGMVSLGRLARGYLGILPKETAPLVVELEQADSPNEDDPISFLIQEVLRLAMIALSDSESYVYLAVRSAEKYYI